MWFEGSLLVAKLLHDVNEFGRNISLFFDSFFTLNTENLNEME